MQTSSHVIAAMWQPWTARTLSLLEDEFEVTTNYEYVEDECVSGRYCIALPATQFDPSKPLLIVSPKRLV